MRLRANIIRGCKHDVNVDKRVEERGEKWAINLQLALIQKLRNFVCETSELCINGEEITII